MGWGVCKGGRVLASVGKRASARQKLRERAAKRKNPRELLVCIDTSG
jgi:hypothetical protein